jgi:putative transposase
MAAKLLAKAKPPAQRPAADILEGLNMSRLLKNHTLAQAIADVGSEECRRQLIGKSRQLGIALYLAHPFFLSAQLCSQCHRLPAVRLTLSERIYHCEQCGLTVIRDLNATRNLTWSYSARSAESDACRVSTRPEVLARSAVTPKQELDFC